MKDTVYVEELPNCYFCGKTAEFDGKTQEGPWAFMCAACFAVHGVGLGLGKGQRLRPREEEPKLLLYKGQPYALEIEGEVFVFYSVGLPDWDLSYVFLFKQKREAIKLLMEHGFRIVKVTQERIYFSLEEV